MSVSTDKLIPGVLPPKEEQEGIDGKPPRAGSVCVVYRLFVHDDRICLCLRDYCEEFDPTSYYEANRDSSNKEYYGIRMVMGHAKEVQYYNTFNSNNLLLYLD